MGRNRWSEIYVSPLVCVVCRTLHESPELAAECAAAHIEEEAERWTLNLSAMSVRNG